jgi:hypothetical protein
MKKHYKEISPSVFLTQGVLTKYDCDWLVASVGNDWDTKLEPVDKEPVWQTKSVAPWGAPRFLHEYAMDIRNSFLINDISDLYNFDRSLLIESTFWPFIRQYSRSGREGFRLHPDPTYFTVVFLLSERESFTGGDLLVKPSLGVASVDTALEQGDCVIFPGTKSHAVTPVVKGYRHSMLFFFWNPMDEEYDSND